MEIAGYLASILMGMALGLTGAGGSILTVPIFVYLFSVAPTTATGYSLFVVGVTAFLGSTIYIRNGEFDIKTGLLFTIPSILGVNISRGLLLPNIPEIIFQFSGTVMTKEILIMALFAALMIAASFPMRNQSVLPVSPSAPASPVLVPIWGLVVGALAGFVGAGGGFLIIPALVVLVRLRMRVAVGTSLLIIAFQSLSGFIGDLTRGAPVNWSLLLTVAGLAAVGITVSAFLAPKIDDRKLKVAFGWFVLLMGTAIMIEQFYNFLIK